MARQQSAASATVEAELSLLLRVNAAACSRSAGPPHPRSCTVAFAPARHCPGSAPAFRTEFLLWVYVPDRSRALVVSKRNKWLIVFHVSFGTEGEERHRGTSSRSLSPLQRLSRIDAACGWPRRAALAHPSSLFTGFPVCLDVLGRDMGGTWMGSGYRGTCATRGRARQAGCVREPVCLDTELSLLGALLPSRCCLFWCLLCHREAMVSPELGEAAARVGSGQCRPEPGAAQRALKQLILQAQGQVFWGVYLKSPLLLTTAPLQLPSCGE